MSSLEKSNNLINSLKKLGVDHTDAAIYVTLLRLGPNIAGKIASELNLERGKVYRSLTSLKNQGLVTTTFGNPMKLLAVSPEEGMQNLIEFKKNEIALRNSEIKEINQFIGPFIDELKEIQRHPKEVKPPELTILEGIFMLSSKLSGIIENSKTPVYILTTLEDMMRIYRSEAYSKIPQSIKNGKEVRVLIDRFDRPSMRLLKELGFKEIRIPSAPAVGRIIVENEKVAILSSDLKSTKNPDDLDAFILTNSPDLVKNSYLFCEGLWQNAKPISKT
ncbi:MAG: TrmB family transcriptional regulator [Candidatus Micrarchaeota archaeon]|nr:TrmB family transcriptional regulator [Candidatus Micrarchaeota archaeon]